MTLVFNPVRLIDEIKARPGLYAAERQDRTERFDLWKEVGAALFRDWGDCNKSTVYARVLQLQKKWKSLRDAYNRELRIRRSNMQRSRIVYRYFKRMSFLGGYDGTISSDEASNGGGDDHFTQMEDEISTPLNQDTLDIPVLKKEKKMKKKRRKRQVSAKEVHSIERAEEIDVPIFPVEFTGESEHDSDRLFLLSFVPEMKQLSVHLKMWARAQIANIMRKAVNCHYNNKKPAKSSGRTRDRQKL